VFHFFTGLHNDYHRPSDDIHKVDIPGLQRICELVSNVVVELATAERPTPLINSSVARPTGGPPPGPGARPSPPKAILGIELDISGTQAMVALVQPRGPAAEAGVRPGDVIVAIGNEPVTSITDLRRIMASKKPGDKSSMTVLRAGENVVLECTFGNG
jgi:S1-C subfamily serine protease